MGNFREWFSLACYNGHLPVVNKLLELPQRILERIDYNAGFKKACSGGSLPVVNKLLKLLEKRLEGIDFNAGFEEACRNSRLPVVNRLLEMADSRNIDVEKGLSKAEGTSYVEKVVVNAIRQYKAQKEQLSDPLTQTEVIKEGECPSTM